MKIFCYIAACILGIITVGVLLYFSRLGPTSLDDLIINQERSPIIYDETRYEDTPRYDDPRLEELNSYYRLYVQSEDPTEKEAISATVGFRFKDYVASDEAPQEFKEFLKETRNRE